MIKLVGDAAQLNSILGRTNTNLAQIQNLQRQIATGERARAYSEISEDSNRLLSTENMFRETDQYMKNIDNVRLRVDMMDDSMQQITDLATEFRALLVNATSAENYSQFDMQNQALDMMGRLETLMNKQVDGKYIFSGTATSTRPVVRPDPLTPPSNDGGVNGNFIPFDKTALTPADPEYAEYFGYYQGNTDLLEVRTDDGQTVEYGIHGGESGFEDLMFAMRLAATFEAGPAGEELSRLENALQMTSDSIGQIVDRHSQFGLQLQEMDRIYDAHSNTKLSLEDIIVEIEGTDVPTAITRLTTLETTVQASYLAVTRMQNTSLLNFLQ